MSLADLIAVGRSDKPADLSLKNARIINTLTSEIEEGDVAIYDGMIAGVGDYHKAAEIIDLDGQFLAPGFINGHIHIESSMLHPSQYARAVVPHGTTSIVTDLHEIANVAGTAGIKFVLDCARELPLDFFFMAPSCVPATHMETAGAKLEASDIAKLIRWKGNIGLGEMMNYPGVVSGFGPVLDKILAAHGKVIDGHAPGLTGKLLNAYIAAGISSDHESTSAAEGKEKLRRGMNLMIREGSSEKNLATLLPLVTDKTWRRCMFVVDDRSCSDLLSDGDVDAVVRKAIRLGLDPIRSIQMATINPAEHFRLYDLGCIAPGYRANLITIADLEKLSVDRVFFNGKAAAAGGRFLGKTVDKTPRKLLRSVNIRLFGIRSLELRVESGTFPVIEIIPGQIVTKRTDLKVPAGVFRPDTENDILKAVVVERHEATGNIGKAMVKGFGLKAGAIASTIAHDSHNLVVVGTSDDDIMAAIRCIEEMHGGLAVCRDGKVVARLPLPICGLLSLDAAEIVSRRYDEIEKAAAALGHLPPAPFALLSFLALPVIPELRVTDKGIVDVLQFKLI
jgi:adenine deaminase